MNSRQHTRLLSLLLAAIWPCTVFGLGTDDVLFHASFDGAPDAILACGSGQASGAAAVEYMRGVLGQAIIVGGTSQGNTGQLGLGYETHQNILRDQGSISLWVQALDWKLGDGKNHRFATVPGRGVTYYFTLLLHAAERRAT